MCIEVSVSLVVPQSDNDYDTNDIWSNYIIDNFPEPNNITNENKNYWTHGINGENININCLPHRVPETILLSSVPGFRYIDTDPTPKFGEPAVCRL